MLNMRRHPLRYRICRWPQAAKCLSNNSKNLHIVVTELVQNKTLTGLLLKVEHAEMGTLFAAMIRGEGQIVSQVNEEGNYIPWMSTSEILRQLKKFGFIIYYDEPSSLDDDVLDVLMKTRNLGYDKITQVVVRVRENGSVHNYSHVIAIKTKENEDLLTFGMTVGNVKFNNRLSAGKIISLDDANVTWEWLDSIYNIDDILQDNADIEKFKILRSSEDPELLPDADESTSYPYLQPEIPESVFEIPEGYTIYDDEEIGNEEG